MKKGKKTFSKSIDQKKKERPIGKTTSRFKKTESRLKKKKKDRLKKQDKALKKEAWLKKKGRGPLKKDNVD